MKHIEIEFNGEKYTLDINAAIAFEKAQQKYNQQDIYGAINEISSIIEISSNQNLYYFRAFYYEEIEKYQNAINDYFKYIDILKDHYFVLFRIGLCYQHLKEWTKAITYYSKALDKNEFSENNYAIVKSSQAYNNRAVCYANLQQAENCISDCTKAITLNPNYANSYFVRGLELCKLRDKNWKQDVTKAANLGYEKAEKYLNDFNAPEIEKDAELYNFLLKVAHATEKNNKQLASVKKPLRTYFNDDWQNKFYQMHTNRTLKYGNILKEAINYTIEMWEEWINNQGSINDIDKASVAYELSQTIYNALPQINIENLYYSIYTFSKDRFFN